MDLGGIEVVDFFKGLSLFLATLGYTGYFLAGEVGEFFQRFKNFGLLMMVNA